MSQQGDDKKEKAKKKDASAQRKGKEGAAEASAEKKKASPKAASREPRQAPTPKAKAAKKEAPPRKGGEKKAAAHPQKPRAARAKAPSTPPGNGKGAWAHAKYVRMAPRKLRLVMDAIRGKSVQEARNILQFCGKRASRPLAKVLNSAVANAENNHHMDATNLVITTAFVDQGPSLRSWIPRARGRASPIHKFSSHITIEVKEREEG